MMDQTGYQKTDPVSGFVDVTSRDTDFSPRPIRLWVAAAGNLELTLANGSKDVLVGVPAGTFIEADIKQINAAGTTIAAGSIKGFTNR